MRRDDQKTDLKQGDIVHVIADNCDLGLGLIVEIMHSTNDPFGYKVLTSDGKSLWYADFEIQLMDLEAISEIR